MKIIITLFMAITLAVPMIAQAQSPEGRLPKTIVADVLAQMPAQNEEIHNRMMQDLVSSGADGIKILVNMMKPATEADNTKASYALGGLAYYVTASGNEGARSMVAPIYMAALRQAEDYDVKAFFIRHLGIMADINTIPTLGVYAEDQHLCQDAVSALVDMDTPESRMMIETVFSEIPDRTVAAYAAGDLRLKSQEDVLLSWFEDADPDLSKSIYYALSHIGGKKSISVLAKAIRENGYSSEQSGLTESYFTLLLRNSQTKTFRRMLKNPDPNVRTAAITSLAEIEGKRILPFILKAMKDPDRRYRNAALEAAAPFADNDFFTNLLGIIPVDRYGTPISEFEPNASFGVEQVIDVVNFVGRQELQGATTRLTPYLTSSDKELRLAAIKALNRIAEPDGMKALVSRLSDPNQERIAEIKDALMWNTNEVGNAVMAVMTAASEPGKIAALEILSGKRVEQSCGIVLDMTRMNGSVGEAAYAALPNVVSENELTALCNMLKDSRKKYSEAHYKYLPQAIGGILSRMPKDRALAAIKPYLGEAQFYQTLPYVGSSEALDVLKSALSENNSKDSALKAIMAWPEFEASSVIYSIFADDSLTNYEDEALKSYIRLMSKGNLNDVQKFLYLRKALEQVKTKEQIKTLLTQIGNCDTFNALMLVGKYLDDPTLEYAASSAVMKIALRDKEYKFWGCDTKSILEKFLKVRSGGDAPYDRAAIEKYIAGAPDTEGYISIFNGADLTGWKGLVENPIARQKMTPAALAKKQAEADEVMRRGWDVRDGVLYFTGKGDNLCTEKKYGDFEMYVDWMIRRDGDAGIYLRGAPQVQIWDTCRRDVGAEVGSGGLYNNQRNPSKPLELADNAIGDWNTFYIKMVGERVTVRLNGVLVVDNTILENYWDRSIPIFSEEQIELQAHGTVIAYRDIYVRELPRQKPFELSEEERAEGFRILFDGVSMHQWTGNTKDYVTENGTITLYPGNGGGGNLYTKDEFSDFVFRFEFMLTPAANNGLGIRTPMKGDAAYVGTELQILDSEHPVYANLENYQYHGSAYGIIPAKRGFLKPTGEWNYQEVEVKGSRVKVTLNGSVILDGDLAKASENGTIDGKNHPGLANTKGHIGFLGHGSLVRFRNIRIKEL